MRTCLSILLLAGLIPLAGADDSKKTPTVNPYASTLEREKIAPTRDGIGAYLDGQDPARARTAAYREQVARLIAQLGDQAWKKREDATRRLIGLPVTPIEELKQAARSATLEIATRARAILVAARDRGATQAVVTHAVFQTIKLRKLRGLARGVLQLLPHLQDDYVVRAGRAAVAVTVQPADLPLLRQALAQNNLELRLAAIGGLAAALGAAAREELHRLACGKPAAVRLAAARALADIGDRSALGLLHALLVDESIEVRLGAIRFLRAFSGQQFGYLAYESPERRKAVAESWRRWIEGPGREARLHFPLRPRRVLLGRTLVCLYSSSKVLELDAGGKKVWEQAVQGAMGCVGLPNGHRLISSHNGNFVVEYDARGNEVWKKTGLPHGLYNVDRLENGNTLVACYSGGKVVEIRPDKSIAWEIALAGNPISAQRLPDGRTLVSLYSQRKVVEVDRQGKVVWSLGGANSPINAVRLENGNTLVCEIGARRVAEYDRAGKLVWQQANVNSPRSAQRLENGQTLISGNNGVFVVDAGGKTVWNSKQVSAGAAHRY